MDFWESLGNILMVFFSAFVFIATLFALFMIFSDLFRDHELKGWKKAIWIVALIFFPILTALIYIIARGDGMAKRNVKQARDAQDATDQYIRSVAAVSPSEEIAKAKALLDAGTISADDFNAIKRHALQHATGGAGAPQAPGQGSPVGSGAVASGPGNPGVHAGPTG